VRKKSSPTRTTKPVAPSRDERRPLEWLAHSFLAVTPREPDAPKRVVPLLGFSWGFVIGDDGRIVLRPVEQLAAGDWNDHLPYLRDCYPSWQFSELASSGAWQPA
jgi:hypothetical protein